MRLSGIQQELPRVRPQAWMQGNSNGAAATPQDDVSLGTEIKDCALQALRTGAGVVGSGVGAALGIIPGATVGLIRGLDATDKGRVTDPNSWSYSHAVNHNEAYDVGKLAEAGTALATATTAAAYAYSQTGHPVHALGAFIAGGTVGYLAVSAFRSLGDTTQRLPFDTDTFPTTATFCADKEMARSISNPINGILIGARQSAKVGKLAFQDLFTPCLNPGPRTPF